MSQTVEEYISENGVQPIFEFLGKFKKNNTQFHTFAKENDIEMDSWFEFGWMLNETLGSRRGDVIPLVDFNYIEIENKAQNILSEEGPLEWVQLVDKTTSSVNNASTVDVSEWLSLATLEVSDTEPEKIYSIEFEREG